MRRRFPLIVVSLVFCWIAAAAQAPDITGTWTASFDTQIGVQTYTYDFVVKGSVLTGTAKSNLGEASITEGKVNGDTVTFVEMLKFEGMEIRIDYTGKIASADEIAFTRRVAEFATEELVARRQK